MFHLFNQHRAVTDSPLFLWGTSVLGSFAWLNPANLNGQITALVGASTTLVLGYISISQMLDKRRHERRKNDLDDEVSRAKALDEARRETLTGQIEALKENQEKMRQSLHEMNEESNRRGLEAASARADLAEATRNFLKVSNQLAIANQQIFEMSAKLRSHSAHVDTVLGKVEAAVETVATNSQTGA